MNQIISMSKVNSTGQKIFGWLKRLPVYYLVPLLMSVRYAAWGILLLFGLIDMPDGAAATSIWDDDPLFVRLFVFVIAIPLIETALFQLLPIEIMLRISKKLKFVAFLCSAVIFAIQHTYSFAYIVYGFLGGLIAILFVAIKKALSTRFGRWRSCTCLTMP